MKFIALRKYELLIKNEVDFVGGGVYKMQCELVAVVKQKIPHIGVL